MTARESELVFPNVGISQIGVAIPEHYIEVTEIAKLRGIDPEFPTKGLGLLEARIPYETSIEDLIVKAVQQIDYQDVKRFYVGTESDSDMSKPLAVTALNKKLGLTIVPVQSKFACVAGLIALLQASEYSIAHGKPAIAIAADRSIYHEEDSQAEITAGCAAVATRIEMNPELLALDYLHYGQYAEDIDDFRVPWHTAPFPLVDGPLTKPAFIKCLKWAVNDWEKSNPGLGVDIFDYFILHVPFVKMVEWYMAMFYKKFGEEKNLTHFSIEECVRNPERWNEYKKIIDEIRETPEFKEFFAKKVKPGLKYNPYIGNCYTASIFICLIAVLEQIQKGQEIGMAGYGSGAGSIVVRGKVLKSGFKSNLQEQIEQKRKKLTIEQYKEWRERTLKGIRATPQP